jgi:ABC-type Fe3+ transport system permease subunit
LLAGLASIATLPVAIYLTRFSDSYDLLHAGFAIPLGVVLGLLALSLSRRFRRRSALRLGRGTRDWPARVGRVLGILGIGLAAAGLVAVAVYWLLEYAGTR